MKQYINLFLLLIMIASDTFAANAGADSLRSLLNSVSGKERVPVVIKIMEKIEKEDPDEAIKSGKEALNILKQYPDKELEAETYYRTGWVYSHLDEHDSAKYFASLTGKVSREAGFNKGEVMELLLLGRVTRNEEVFEDALKYLDAALEKNSSDMDIVLQAKIYNEKGSVLRRLSRYDEAYSLHLKTLELFKEFNDDAELRITYTYLGIISDIQGRYNEALEFHHQALETAEKIPDKRGAAAAIHNIGILYQKIASYGKALEYYYRALDYWKEINNKDGLASTLNSIGAIHELRNNPDEALTYYEQALQIWEELGSKYSISVALNNLGNVYLSKGNYTKASEYLNRSLRSCRSLGDKNGMASALITLAEVYSKQGKFEQAVASAKEGIKTAEEIGSWSSIRHSHKILGRIYESNGYYKEALSEFKKYQAAHDSVFNIENQQVIAELEEKYKSDEQKKQIEILQKDSEIQSLHRTYLIIGIILLIFLVLLIYNRYRLKQRAHFLRTEAAESKAAIIQVGFDQKTKELNAARDLQLSMLPSVIPVHPDITVAAKMITSTEVGGDYYDFYKCDEDTFTIAIGDATGHGARAGIMVTAVKSLFTLLAGEKDLTDILCRSTRAIKKMRFSNLFMAMALLRIKGNELEYAGAGMPPAYIFRKETGDVEELSLKGLPLGIAAGNEYSKCITKLNSGDTVLLMSDGFPELFNQEGESLGFDKIPLLLKESGQRSPEEIINYLTDKASSWLNGKSQQDDMTFVVFKMN